MATTDFVPRTIINGKMLRQFINQNVSLIVQVENDVQLQIKSFTGKTTDNVEVTIELDQQLTSKLQGWIEVIGIPDNANTIRSKEIIIFPNEDKQPFDKESHNHLVTFLNNCKELYSTC